MKTRPDLALVSRMGAVFGVTVAVIAVTRFNGDCQGECLQEWRTSPGRNKGEFALLNGSGYGRCPTAYFRKIDGSWRLIETRMVDHGAP